jgi:hypothetical protein
MHFHRTLMGLCLLTAMASAGCIGGELAYNLPPSEQIMHPGPGVGGPGPGVIPPAGGYGGPGVYGPGMGRFGDASNISAAGGTYAAMDAQGAGDGGVVQASYGECGEACGGAGGCANGMCGPGGQGILGGPPILGGRGLFGRQRDQYMVEPASCDGGSGPSSTSQIAFLGEQGIQVHWDVSSVGMFDSTPLAVPSRQDFYQGAIYRLKLTNIPGRPEVELYPTLEVAPVTPRTDAYLAHSPIPVQFTQEDFDQVVSGNFVTKVIYLPDPEFQELALAGVETLVSTRLDPGVDPIAEADRRGSILAILRMGNKDLEPNNVVSGSVPVEYGSDSYYEPGMAIEPGMAEPMTEPMVEPMSYEKPAGQANATRRERTADYQQGVADSPDGREVAQADYCYDGAYAGGGAYADGYVEGTAGTMPVGMPTAGFAPPPVPPHMIAGGGDWGMPITGTPIGLPGPPHIPLGAPAGLRKHVMHNRTRVNIPPPNAKMNISVKQRPGMNYPRPVTQVRVEETQREPFRLWPFGNWFGRSGHFANGQQQAMAAGYPTNKYPCN